MAKAKAKAPTAIAIVAAALDKAVSGDVKPKADGSVKVALAIGQNNLHDKRQRAEEFAKGQMKGTLDRIWWNLRWKYRKNEDARYGIFIAVPRMPLVIEKDKAYLVLTGEEVTAAREAVK